MIIKGRDKTMAYRQKNKAVSEKTKAKRAGSRPAVEMPRWLVLPVILVMAVVPLLVRVRTYPLGLSQFAWFSGQEEGVELFLMIKQQALILAAIVMFVLTCYYAGKVFGGRGILPDNFLTENGKWKWDKALFALLAYLALAILSTVVSPYASYGYRGAHEQFESLFVLLSYGVIVIYTFWAAGSEKSMKLLETGFLVGISVMCLLGVLQFSGHDFFRTKFGQSLILPGGGELKFTFPPNQVYLSLYNPNYVGQYVSLLLPVMAALLISRADKKMRIWYGLLILGLLLCLVGSGSKTAFITLIFSVFLMLLVYRRKLRENKKVTVLGLTGAAVFVAVMIALMGNSFFERLGAALRFPTNPEYALSALAADENKIRLTYQGETADLVADSSAPGGFRLLTEDGREIPAQFDTATQTYTWQEGSWQQIPLQIFPDGTGEAEMAWLIAGKNWHFYYQATGFYYVTPYGKADRVVEIEKGLFQNHESFATYRGYIWSRTFPLLKKYLFLGSGADSFTLVFPQHDYLGKVHNNFDNVLITRPHNLYLQIAVQTGGLSLLAVLAFYLMYLLSSIRLYWRSRFEDYYSQTGAAVLIGSLGYMVSSVFNDSTITVAPVFWALMGVGLAMNYQVRKKESVSE